MASPDGIPISVKWGKETIELNLVVANGVKGLKEELEEQTGVPSDRMKLMAKSKGLWKGLLKDDFDLSTIDFAAAQSKASNKTLQILLMGSATKLAAPKTKTVFIEDLPPEEAAKVAPEPSGLVNLGNTCYLNSVVQCIRAIRFFRNGLTGYSGGRGNASSIFLSSLRELYDNLDRTASAVSPANFVMATRMAFPQFAERSATGQPKQQDAEEFYSGLLEIARQYMEGRDSIRAGFNGITVTDEEVGDAQNLIDAVFGVKMEETLTCDEFASASSSSSLGGGATAKTTDMEVDGKEQETTDPTEAVGEPPVKSYSHHRKLVCNIQGGSDTSAQTTVNHIAEGIALSLNDKVEKRSEVLGRDAMWTRTHKLARLPPILVVQFGRFYWKETPDSQDHAGVKCKVMRPVAFSGTLDVYEFCTDEVKKVLKVARDKALAEEEDRIAKKLRAAEDDEGAKKEEGKGEDKKEGDPMETEAGGDDDHETAKAIAAADDAEAAELRAAMAMSVETTPDEPLPPVGPGLPKDFQGQYELFAVVTHKGRDADGGHYMAWVKADNDGSRPKEKIADTDEVNDDWFVFDDDEVSPCKTEDVLKLKGGGDWHMSYLNFYRAKK